MAPTISRLADSAKRQRCRGNLIVLHRAFEMYRQTNKGYYPHHHAGVDESIFLLEKYQSDIASYLRCPGSGHSGSYAYDQRHTDNDGDTIVFGDSPSLDEIREKPGPSDNHDGCGGYYLRVDGNIDYLFGAFYRRNRKIHNLFLLDNIFEKDPIFGSFDTALAPLVY